MSHAKNLKRILVALESERARALTALEPDHLDDQGLERLARVQLAIQAVREILDGERKQRELDEWLQRADEE